MFFWGQERTKNKTIQKKKFQTTKNESKKMSIGSHHRLILFNVKKRPNPLKTSHRRFSAFFFFHHRFLFFCSTPPFSLLPPPFLFVRSLFVRSNFVRPVRLPHFVRLIRFFLSFYSFIFCFFLFLLKSLQDDQDPNKEKDTSSEVQNQEKGC